MEPIDVVMLTLDADSFLERCLYSAYREIPIRKLLVCDGGSKDETHSIFGKFPRVELFVRPDIRTTGKGLEFVFSKVETEWCVILDADIELAAGWFDEMSKSKDAYDLLESGKMVNAYHMYREDPLKMEENQRSFDMCHLARRSAVQTFRCDDDFMWRVTDILLRQNAEKSGFKYGKICTTLHVEHETERIRYESDTQKSYQKVVWDEPRFVIIDKEKYWEQMIRNGKAVVKYLNPDHSLVRGVGFDFLIKNLDRKWVEQNGPQWLERYDKPVAPSLRIKRAVIMFITKRFPDEYQRLLIGLLRKLVHIGEGKSKKH